MTIHSDFQKNFQNRVQKYDKMRTFTPKQLKTFQKHTSIDNTMKVKSVLETRREKSNGKYPVKIRFMFGKQAFYIPVGIDCTPDNFDAATGFMYGVSSAYRNNIIIKQKLDQVSTILHNLEVQGIIRTQFANGKELRRFIEDTLNGESTDLPDKPELLFSDYLNNYIQKYSEKSTRSIYELTLKKVAGFVDIKRFSLNDITVSWLKDFNVYCLQNNMSDNGVAIYMRCIRALYNDAIDRDLLSLGSYPFRRFKIKRAKTAHRNVTVQDLRSMLRFDYAEYLDKLKAKAKKHTSVFPDVERWVDLFFLSFYLCGMNIKDIVFLEKSDIRNGQLSITRYKTNEPVLLRIETEAQRIIDKYPGKKYLLSFIDTYKTEDYRSMERHMNRNIKHVLPFITAYWARHSWATIAGELDVPDPIIDIAQGRTPQGMTGIYTLRNYNKVAEANRKVIDYLNEITTY